MALAASVMPVLVLDVVVMLRPRPMAEGPIMPDVAASPDTGRGLGARDRVVAEADVEAPGVDPHVETSLQPAPQGTLTVGRGAAAAAAAGYSSEQQQQSSCGNEGISDESIWIAHKATHQFLKRVEASV